MSSDPLDDLRAAWKGLDAPDAAERGGEELSGTDERTRETVLWMRAAWGSLEVPPVPARPESARRSRPHLSEARPSPVRDWLWLSAAAAVVAFWILAALHGKGAPVAETPNIEHSTVAGAEELTPPETHEPVRDEQLQIAALEPGRLELRSGPVRLILLSSPSPVSSAGGEASR